MWTEQGHYRLNKQIRYKNVDLKATNQRSYLRQLMPCQKLFDQKQYFHWQRLPAHNRYKLIMGSIFDTANEGSTIPAAHLEYLFGQDATSQQAHHDASIVCRSQSIESKMLQCATQLKQSHCLYKDPSTDTNPLLLRPANTPSSSDNREAIRANYLRPSKFLLPEAIREGKYRLRSEINSSASQIVIRDQVQQYFGMVLCFLADHPELIDKIFLTKPSTFGIHGLQMHIHGQPHEIFIDDYILCSGDKPLFAQPIADTFPWPCLVERAWLKVTQSEKCNRIGKNSVEETFDAFLSLPVQKYPCSSVLISKYFSAPSRNQTFIFTSKREPNFKIGLSGRKHYYCLGAFEHEGKKLFCLRDPCGYFEFRGQHHTPSQEISRLALQTTKAVINNGNFILDESELVEQIDELLVCTYLPNTSVISEQELNLHDNKEFFVTTEIKKEDFYSFRLYQCGVLPNGQYFPLTYQVIDLKTNTLVSGKKNSEGCFGMRNTFLLEEPYCRLEKGKYLIRLKKKPIGKMASPTLSKIISASSEKIRFTYLAVENLDLAFIDFLKVEGRRNLELKRTTTKEDINHAVCWLNDIVFIYIKQNNMSKKTIQLEVHFPELLNLKCLSHNIGCEYTYLEPFADCVVIVFEKIDLTAATRLGKYTLESF